MQDNLLLEWIYEYRDLESRYVLGVKGSNPLLCFGINPSTAKPNDLDNTVKSVERISIANGYDGWIMFNIYPQRSTDPNGLHGEIDAELHQENLRWLDIMLTQYHAPDVWVAWGNLIEKRTYLAPCLFDVADVIHRHGCRCISAGKFSVLGHPHHPLYLKKDQPLDPFDLDNYIVQFRTRLTEQAAKKSRGRKLVHP